MTFQPQTVLPGDDVTSLLLPSTNNNNKNDPDIILDIPNTPTSQKRNSKQQKIKLGKGLHYHSNTNTITCTLAGTLMNTPIHSNSNSNSNKKTYYIRQNSKRYIPHSHDRIIGIIEETFSDHYKVNCLASHPGLLPVLAFENATKRNRPHLSIGSMVYCRVEQLFDQNVMDPMLSCKVNTMEEGANRKDWMTDENTYGELKGGTCLQVSLGLVRQLLHPQSVILTSLGKHLAFEIAIGVNGIVWVHSPSVDITILICNAIQNSEVMTPEQVRGMVRELVKRIPK